MTARALELWEEVGEILARPVPDRSPDQLALYADPTLPASLFDVDAPDWRHHEIRIASTDGDLPQYHAECSCGFAGLWLFVEASARREADRHLANPTD